MLSFLKNLSLGSLRLLPSADGHVALDIGSSSIKMVEAAIDKNGYRILNLGISPLPENAIQNNMVVDAAPVVEAICGLLQERGVKSKQVISAVPGRAVMMKKVQMPKQEPAELEANMEFEAQNVIPDSLQNVNLDYQIVHDDGAKMDVLLVAVKKEIINSYTQVIESAGLVPKVMDVDYFALENMYETSYLTGAEKGIVALVHIGSRYTTINLLEGGASIYTGDLPLGNVYFTENIARERDVAIELAETVKAKEGKQETEFEDFSGSALQELADEIKRTMTLYGTAVSTDHDGSNMIFLSGGGAKVPGLCAFLEKEIGLPVRLSEPFRGFELARKIDRDYLRECSPLFALAAGLSIRRPGDR